MIKILEIILLSLPIFNNVSYHNSHLLITQLMLGRATGVKIDIIIPANNWSYEIIQSKSTGEIIQ